MDMNLIAHNCPIEGKIMVERNKPCNWCGKIEYELKLVVKEKK